MHELFTKPNIMNEHNKEKIKYRVKFNLKFIINFYNVKLVIV